MRTRTLIAVIWIAQLVVSGLARAETETCTRVEFESVVDEAAAALRSMNGKNTPLFQEKLRSLKEQRGWTHDQFLAAAVPFVKDDAITVYDQKIDEFLNKINSMGEVGSTASTPDCKLLSNLRSHMNSLVEAMQGKWDYMFKKINQELALAKPK